MDQQVPMAWPGELSSGSIGPAVELLHRRLAFVLDDGTLVGPKFDERTERAIETFLRQNGLDVVDVVGERLWNALAVAVGAANFGHTEKVLGPGVIRSVAWSPAGGLAAAGDDGLVRVWYPGAGKSLACLEGHTGAVRSVAWSPDGGRLASAGDDGSVQVWHPGTGARLARLEGHPGAVRSVAWSRDGGRLASAGDGGAVGVWDAGTGKNLARENYRDAVNSVAWSPDGGRLAVAVDDGSVWVRDARTGESDHLGGHTGRVNSVAWSPDGGRLAVAGDGGSAWVWHVGTGEIVDRLEGYPGALWSVAWSRDGGRLAVAGGSVWVWHVGTGEIVDRLEGHRGALRSVAWSSDGGRLVSAGDGGTVWVWDAGTGESLARLEVRPGAVWSVAWSPDGGRLASASDRGLWVWDAGTGESLARLEVRPGAVWSVAWSPDGGRLATASDGGSVRVWDAGTGQTLAFLEGHPGPVYSVAWSRNGGRLASAGDGGSVWVWDAGTGESLARLEGHPGAVWSVAWSPDGSRLATAGDDQTVRVWDLALRAPTAAYASPASDQVGDADVDALGIEDDVRGLASVVAAKSVEPPLSIGLFADWGGGKSFFIKLLKGRVDSLEKSGHPAFCSGIRSIDFNAWHFRDADLWSSLASHIFETLATDPVTTRRVTKVSAVAIEAALRKELEHREEKQRELRVARHGPPGRGSEKVREAVEGLHRAAGGLDIGAAQIDRVSGHARAVQYVISLPWLAIRRMRLRNWLFMSALVVVGLVAAWLLVAVGGTVWRWLAGLSWLTGAVVAIRAAQVSLLDVWLKLRPFLKKLAEARADTIKELEGELDQTDHRIQELNDQLAGAVSSRRLLAYIQGRSESPDYRERLGVINLIRRDFVEMAELLGKSAAEPGVGGRRIDRIVLYIDDLDRCPSQRVVEVLEAVHLILNIPLFVVVLAVDPRWLVKSLELHYSELLSAVTEDEGITAESHWTATPVNYLEKILQVPYTLRPMTDRGYATLMFSLLAPLPASDGAASTAALLEPSPSTTAGQSPFPPARSTPTGNPGHSPALASASTQPGAGPDDDEKQGISFPPAAAAEPPLRHVPIIFRTPPPWKSSRSRRASFNFYAP